MSAGKSRAWLRNALVVSEVAFASILLVGAGLLVRSFVRVLDVNLGFEPEHTAVLRVDSTRISNLAQQNAFLDDMLQRARSIPGVRSAGVSDVLPFAGDRSWQVSAKGHVYPKGQYPPEPYIRMISDGYFEAAGIRLEAGREFTEQDRASSEKVVIVNQTLARTLWPGQDPIGQVVTQDGGRRVIGVVADVRHEALEKTGGSEMYIPLRQTGDYSAHANWSRERRCPGSIRFGNSSGATSAGSKSADP